MGTNSDAPFDGKIRRMKICRLFYEQTVDRYIGAATSHIIMFRLLMSRRANWSALHFSQRRKEKHHSRTFILLQLVLIWQPDQC